MLRPIYFAMLSVLLIGSAFTLTHLPAASEGATLPPTLTCKNFSIGLSIDTFYARVDSFLTSRQFSTTCKVRRLSNNFIVGRDTSFRDSIAFACSDVGKTIMVEVRAEDDTSFTTCMASITVSDKLAPVIVNSLNDITISCDFPINLGKLDTFGKYVLNPDAVSTRTIEGTSIADGIVDDLCDSVKIATRYRDSRQCGRGTLVRYFTFTDRGNNVSQDSQIISIINTKPFTADSITWPRDTTIIVNGAGGCSTGPYPANLGGVPSFKGMSACVMPQFSKSDMVFNDPNSGCPAIMRTWRVYEMCTFTADQTSGYYERVQNIFLRDTIAPKFTSACTNTTIVDSTGACKIKVNLSASATDNCTKTADIIISYKVSIGSDTIASGVGKNYMATLDPGLYTIMWIADDRCGNRTLCTYQFRTRESKAPSPVALSSLVLGITKGGATVRTRDFNRESFDNCSPKQALKYSFSADVNDTMRTVTCANLGANELRFFVTDEAGNTASVKVTLNVQDKENFCRANTFASISGQVSTLSGEMLPEVGLSLEGAEQQRKVMTDRDGKYSMTNLERDIRYELNVRKEGRFIDGVDVLDLIELQSLLLGYNKDATAAKRIAADIDGDQKLTISDLYDLWYILLGSREADPDVSPAWRVVDEEKLKTTDPWPLTENLVFETLSDDQHVDFKAIKLGDLDQSYQHNANGAQKLQSRSTANIYYQDQLLRPADKVSVAIKIEKAMNVKGQQFRLKYEPRALDVLAVTLDGKALDRGAVIHPREGYIDIILADAKGINYSAGQTIVEIQGYAKAEGELSSFIALGDAKPAFAATTDGSLHGLRLLSVDKSDLLKVYQNTPNPFDDYTNINFTISQDMPVEITVLDHTGKSVYHTYNRYTKGEHTLQLRSDDLQGSVGVFFIKIECAEAAVMKKMLRIK